MGGRFLHGNPFKTKIIGRNFLMGKMHRWVVIVAFLIIIICGWIAVSTIFMEKKDIVVPSVVGTQLIDAVDLLQSRGLLAKVDKIDSPERADTVISQNIPEGVKVAKGKVLLIKVSKGGSIVPIPDVRGMKFEEGIKRLSEAGFKVDKVMRVTDKLKPAGSIIAQNPAAPQTVAANAMVSIIVSLGSDGEGSFVLVPDLIGLDIESAKKAIEKSDLSIGVTNESPSASTSEGTVLSTSPRKGASVPAGTTINITVSRALRANEMSSERPPMDNQNKEREEVVRKIVIKESAPVKIPLKTDSNIPADKKTELKVVEKGASVELVPVSSEKTNKSESEAKVETLLTDANKQKKTAKIRYQTPPLSKPLSLKIEMRDSSGIKIIKEGTAKSGEYISLDVPYIGASTVMITLGGDLVWQDRFN